MAGTRKVRTVSEVKARLKTLESQARPFRRGLWGLFAWVCGSEVVRQRDVALLRWFLGGDWPGLGGEYTGEGVAWDFIPASGPRSKQLQEAPIRPATMATCLKDGPVTPRPALPAGQVPGRTAQQSRRDENRSGGTTTCSCAADSREDMGGGCSAPPATTQQNRK